MLAAFSRTASALALLTLFFAPASEASAQWFPWNNCNTCAQPVAMAAPVAVASNPCPCLQPVQQTVYREVPVTRMIAVERTVQRPVIRTAYEDREVTAYRTEYEQRVAEVPTVSYQNVTDCQPVTVNRSYYQTSWQPVPKVPVCEYDSSPTMLGAFNRMSYSMRMAMTPNYVPQRQYVQNMVAVNVPRTRTVAIRGTRQVAYNVAKTVPYTTTQRVAVQHVEYENQTVTAWEPQTEMRTVAVGTTTRYAYVNPENGTATAQNPTPAQGNNASRTAEAPANNGTTPNNTGNGTVRGISYPQPQVAPQPTPDPSFFGAQNTAPAAQPTPQTVPTAVVVAGGWRTARDAQPTPVAVEATPTSGPILTVAR